MKTPKVQAGPNRLKRSSARLSATQHWDGEAEQS